MTLLQRLVGASLALSLLVGSVASVQSIALAQSTPPAQQNVAEPSEEETPTIDPVLLQLQVMIPGFDQSDIIRVGAGEDVNGCRLGYVCIKTIESYLNALYRWAAGAAVILAITIMMIGGVEWMTGSAVGTIDKGKKRIQNALLGLLFVFGTTTLLSFINPDIVALRSVDVQLVKGLPAINRAHGTEVTVCGASALDLYGVSDWQDCMLDNYGTTQEEIQSQLVTVTSNGRSYQVHQLAAADFQAALDEIAASGVDYNIGRDTAGGTYNWRCNRNNTAALSSHSFGTSIDINPSTNPNCSKGCRTGGSCRTIPAGKEDICALETEGIDLPDEVINAFKSNNFSWGGDWYNTKDYMHFQHVGVCPL